MARGDSPLYLHSEEGHSQWRSVQTALADTYTIESEVGAGGMATVYLARDLKHDRKVALKVLRDELAAVVGAGRFLEEIRVTAQLQHPHILPLHDSGRVGGTAYYVMPFVEGESLRDKLRREKQLPVAEAVTIAIAVAEALAYAHEEEIIHRDIKPENILLQNGQAVVTDFGIALALSRTDGASRLTETGLSLGTPQYMSPEQAMGEHALDPRSDVYALGCVLYEMLTGQPPFVAPTAQAVIAKVLTSDPEPVKELRRTVPDNIATATMRALERIPADRFSGARAFADALKNDAFAQRSVLPRSPSVTRGFAWGGALVVAAALLLFSVNAMWRREPPVTMGAAVLSEVPHAPFGDTLRLGSSIDVSQDGSRWAYVATRARVPGSATPAPTNEPEIVLRERDGSIRILANTRGALKVVLSPDAAEVAFIAKPGGPTSSTCEIKRLSISDNRITSIGSYSSNAAGCGPGLLTWTGENTLFGSRIVDRRVTAFRVPLDGGAIESVPGSPLGMSFVPLPNNDVLIAGLRLAVFTPGTGKQDTLGIDAANARYLPSGHILVDGPDGLSVVEYDVRQRRLRGKPVVLLDTAATGGEVRAFASDARGTILVAIVGESIALAGIPDRRFAMVNVASPDRDSQITLPPAPYTTLALSPDARRIAYTLAPGAQPHDTSSLEGLFVKDIVLNSTQQLVAGLVAARIAWSPDGQSIAFNRSGDPEPTRSILRVLTNGKGVVDTLFTRNSVASLQPLAFSSDGRRLLFLEGRQAPPRTANTSFIAGAPGARNVIFHLCVATLGPNGRWSVATYLGGDNNVRDAALSPDGKWLAYVSSDELSRGKVYVRSFPTPGDRHTVSTGIGLQPQFSEDGKNLYYWATDSITIARAQAGSQLRHLVAARVESGAEFRVTSLDTLLARPRFTGSTPFRDYAVYPGGNRFLLLQNPLTSAAAPRQPPRLWIIANWLAEFRKKSEQPGS